MNNENWTPGHSLNKGYPYNGIESRRMFKNRPETSINEDGKVIIHIEANHFPDFRDQMNEWSDQAKRTSFEDFLLLRLHDFQESLAVAEGQLFDILEEKPFIPENYGFNIIHKNKDIKETPVRIYKSIYNHNLTLFRKPAEENGDPSLWTLMEKTGDDTFKETEILLPCDRIAYAAFYSLRVNITPPEGKEGNSGPVREGKPADGKYKVLFKREKGDIQATCTVDAFNESDALTKAKFHFETDEDYGIEDVKPEELSIV